MTLDTQLDHLENGVIKYFNERSGFITSYFINPLLFELVFHSSLAPIWQMRITSLLLFNQLVQLYNRSLFHPLMLIGLLSPFYMLSSSSVNLLLYGLLANSDTYTSMLQSFFGFTISHVVGVPAGIFTVAVIGIARDCFLLQFYIENRDTTKFYEVWHRLHGGLALHERLWSYQKEWFDCIDKLLTRSLYIPMNFTLESDQE
jgi:hypothetical protein